MKGRKSMPLPPRIERREADARKPVSGGSKKGSGTKTGGKKKGY